MNKRILICDDDKDIAEVIKIMLEQSGYQTKLLSTGKAIQKRIKEYLPGLIILDLWMPGIDGKEITKILKSSDETKNIPIIVFSALNEAEKISKEIGAEDFLNKPFEMDNLLNKVKKHLEK